MTIENELKIQSVVGVVVVGLFVLFVAFGMGYVIGDESGHREATYQQRIRCLEEQGKY